MNDREKAAHLLRRFGLGATRPELQRAEKEGIDKTLDRLLNYEDAKEEFDFPFWSFAIDNNLNANFDSSRFIAWWTLRLLTTNRPLEHNLSLFWHDHFAVGGSKVTFGPMMVEHVETLRKHASGSYRTLLGAVARDPAMLRWLDTDVSVRGKPNENFARELMELFTLGVGNGYTEKDVQELSRVFTGWSVRNAIGAPGRRNGYLQMMDVRKMDCPWVVWTDSPGLRDDRPKTILGQTKDFTPDDAMDHVLKQPGHAPFMARKLWEYFAYPNPEAAVVERIASAYAKSKYDIKSTLLAIAKTKEFWSEKAMRSIVKSPAHFSVALGRQLGTAEILRAANLFTCDPDKNVPGPIANTASFFALQMRRQGMTLLFPPDAAGWNWGESWISTGSIIERRRLVDLMFRAGNSGFVRWAATELGSASDAASAVAALCELVDAPADAERQAILVEAFEKGGGMAALKKANTAAQPLVAVMRLVSGLPEFQMA